MTDVHIPLNATQIRRVDRRILWAVVGGAVATLATFIVGTWLLGLQNYNHLLVSPVVVNVRGDENGRAFLESVGEEVSVGQSGLTVASIARETRGPWAIGLKHDGTVEGMIGRGRDGLQKVGDAEAFGQNVHLWLPLTARNNVQVVISQEAEPMTRRLIGRTEGNRLRLSGALLSGETPTDTLDTDALAHLQLTAEDTKALSLLDIPLTYPGYRALLARLSENGGSLNIQTDKGSTTLVLTAYASLSEEDATLLMNDVFLKTMRPERISDGSSIIFRAHSTEKDATVVTTPSATSLTLTTTQTLQGPADGACLPPARAEATLVLFPELRSLFPPTSLFQNLIRLSSTRKFTELCFAVDNNIEFAE